MILGPAIGRAAATPAAEAEVDGAAWRCWLSGRVSQPRGALRHPAAERLSIMDEPSADEGHGLWEGVLKEGKGT